MKSKIPSLLIIILLAFFATLRADQKSGIEKVYKHIAKNGKYLTVDGKVIYARSFKKTCRDSVCQLIINGKEIQADEVHYIKGKQIVNLLSGRAVRSMSDKQRIALGFNPSKLRGKEPGVLKGITAAHNYYRKKAGVPPLGWSNKIAAYSKKWANYLQKNNGCRMKHREGNFKIESYGENLAFASGKQLNSYYVVKAWYDEIKYYNYKRNSCSKVCGHYTQVIWKTSKRVGCAIAYCKNSEVWVCNYDPPGNHMGKRPY